MNNFPASAPVRLTPRGYMAIVCVLAVAFTFYAFFAASVWVYVLAVPATLTAVLGLCAAPTTNRRSSI